MALELRQELRLSQQLVMTPQLQQAIKLLQLNRLELVGLVQQELEENPVLEEAAEVDDDENQQGEESEAADRELEASLSEDSTDVVPREEPADSADDPTDAEKFADIEWQDYINSNPQTSTPVGGEDDRPSIDATLTRTPRILAEDVSEFAVSTEASNPYDPTDNPTGVMGKNRVRVTLGTTTEDAKGAETWSQHVDTFTVGLHQ